MTNELAVRQTFSLESMDEFRAALASIHDLGEIRRIHDLTEAARRYAQTGEEQRMASEAKLWAAFRGGELLAEMPVAGRNQHTGAILPVEKTTSHRWQKLYAKTSEWLEDYIGATEEPTMAEALRTKDVAELLVASTQNEWYTPEVYIKAARKVLGGIDLDPASSTEANQTVQAKTFFTAAEDGLSQDWFGRVWLNPPYGRLAGGFIERLAQDFTTKTITGAVALVNAHCTDTDWFQCLWSHTLCFTDHRIDFDSAGREKKTSSTHGSVFAYLGDDVELFRNEFSQFGAVVRRA